MKREKLIRFGVLTVTPDTAQVLEKAARQAVLHGFKIDFQKPEPWWELPASLSMLSAGRGVFMRAVFEEDVPLPLRLARLWAVTVPLQITPWDRDPLPSATEHVFHYLGPWQTLYQRLIASGEGEHAWVSACIAAQCDVGVWEGDRKIERFVQAQLHRIGQNPGPVDGRIGPRTVAAIHALGMKSLKDLKVLAEELKNRQTGVISSRNRVYGHVVVPGREMSVAAHGKVRAVKTAQGVALTVDGPGRVIVDIEGA